CSDPSLSQAVRLHLHLPSFPTRRASDLVPHWRPPRGTEELWQSVAHAADRFALALLRRELGAEPPDDPAWDAESLVQDVWSASSDRKSTRLNSSHVKI